LSRQPVLILGAGGFIGRRIVAALAATDWASPIAASRSIANTTLDVDVPRMRLDATDVGALQAALGSVSAVVSCISGEAQQIIRSGEALLNAAARAPTSPRVVYLSSMDAYGSVTGAVDETAPLRGDFGAYSRAKATIDALTMTQSGTVTLRPGIVYGAGSTWWSDRIARLLIQRRLGDLGGRGAGLCNLVHVDDVAAAVLRALQVPEAGGQAFNLANPQPPTWNGYFYRYAQALGALPLRGISSGRLLLELKLYGPALKAAEAVLRGANPWRHSEAIRPWLARLCGHHIQLDSHKAEKVLGLRFRDLDAGLAETAAWFLSGGRT
jgi:nucleoside-diphosphate-sugar epimerase